MLDFRVSIGLLPLVLIVLDKMKPCYEGLKEIDQSWCWWDMKEKGKC